VEKLQKLDLNTIADGLAGTTFAFGRHVSKSRGMSFGGACFGHFSDIKTFLSEMTREYGVENFFPCRKGGKAPILEDTVTVKSHYEDLGQVELSQLDLEELDSHIVFFHMNLTTLYSCEKDIFR
jgi:hypothetical protein